MTNKAVEGYGVGILGNCCTHGEFVAAALKAEAQARIIAAWEKEPQRQPGLAQAIGRPLARSGEELLDNPEIEIIALACSPHEKADWVEKAVQAGKHIFLNKPMAESLVAGRRIERAIRHSDRQLVYDIPVIVRFHPLTAKILAEVRAGEYGRPVNYMHTFSFTFSLDFPLATIWPERLDPPAETGGGELTNLGCYAVDYMVALWGRPATIQARSSRYWDIYDRARVENFGQIIADYGSFFAVLASGKQPLQSLPSMDVGEALHPRNWHNVLELQFEHHNLTVLPFHNLLIHNGRTRSAQEFLAGYECLTPFQQLVQAIETATPPDSNVEVAALGVEVLMAAYKSIVENGKMIELPLVDGANPLIN
jgi:predicted dehydrogenase